MTIVFEISEGKKVEITKISVYFDVAYSRLNFEEKAYRRQLSTSCFPWLMH